MRSHVESIHEIKYTGINLLEPTTTSNKNFVITVSSYLSTSLEYSLITFYSIKGLQKMNLIEDAFKR